MCEKFGNSIEAEPDVEENIDAENKDDFSKISFESANKVETPHDDKEGKLSEICGKLKHKNIFHYHSELLQSCKICKRKFKNNLEKHMKIHKKSKN
jgi:hypothetical protein